MTKRTFGSVSFKVFVYAFCIILAILSIFPFYTMVINGTRSSMEVMSRPIAFLPGTNLDDNMAVLDRLQSFNAITGFRNSLVISGSSVLLAIYFSSLTAFALTAYDWRLRQPFFTFILAVMMIPGQIVAIGFYMMVWRLDLINNYLPLILPAIASPGIVFFMRQYLIATFSPDIVNSARIDGAGEFRIFNTIILPIMKPALATQAIFVFVTSWNALFMPMMLLTNNDLYTMPKMVTLLNSNIYDTEYGAIYLGLTLSILPIFVVYMALSRYIIAGVQLGGIKE